MIIQCQSCSRKFIVKDSDIPSKGRTVQCGYCSVNWHQMPIRHKTEIKKKEKVVTASTDIEITKVEEGPSIDNMKASDGRTYRFLGSQWAELLPSGKTGIFAKKKIGIELDKIAGIDRKKTPNKIFQKSKVFDPSSVSQKDMEKLPDIYKPKNGIGFFGYIFILLIVFLSLVGAIKTFEDYWLYYFPQDILFFAFIDQQLDFFTETFKNMITIVQDLIDSY